MGLEEQREAYQELRKIVAAYDGSIPFPEFVARYQQEHMLKNDYSIAAQYIVLPNDPRGRAQRDE